MSTGKKYSFQEIDRLRNAVRDMHFLMCSANFKFNEKHAEEKVRTYMMNGTTPEELENYIEEWVISVRGPNPLKSPARTSLDGSYTATAPLKEQE